MDEWIIQSIPVLQVFAKIEDLVAELLSNSDGNSGLDRMKKRL